MKVSVYGSCGETGDVNVCFMMVDFVEPLTSCPILHRFCSGAFFFLMLHLRENFFSGQGEKSFYLAVIK